MADDHDKGRILFVDDEPNVLRSIRRGLRRHRGRWEMAFALGADDALSALAAAPVGLVVSDVKMPGTDGIALLSRVKDAYPDAARILISGTSEAWITARAVPVAHQFLSKPFDIQELVRVIERVFALREMLSNEAVRAVIGGVDAVPSAPDTYAALCRALDDPLGSLDDIAGLVEADPGLASQVLHVVNSAFFAAAREIRDVGEAVRYLGTRTLRELALLVDVFRRFEAPDRLPISLTDEMQHALRCAQAAQAIAPRPLVGAAYTAGLLHDIGKLVCAGRAPTMWAPLLSRAEAEGRPLHEIEQEVLGTTHAEIGAYLLGLWGLPSDIVEAVERHHAPPAGSCDLAAIVHVANALADEARGVAAVLDEALIARLGLGAPVARWRATGTASR